MFGRLMLAQGIMNRAEKTNEINGAVKSRKPWLCRELHPTEI